MKKIMGHVTSKWSLSILTMFVLLVGVLAGLNKITLKKASAAAASKVSASKITKEAVTSAMAKVPMEFEPNRGQTDSRVKYAARAAGYNVFLTGGSSATMVFPPAKGVKAKADRLTMNLVGANAAAQDHAEAVMKGVTNYYIGSSKRIQNIPNYAQIRYSEVYRGIDVTYQGDNDHFRYDFTVQPGADPKAIRIAYQGAEKVSLNEKGEVVAAMNQGESIISKPYVYQEIGGKKHQVEAGYVLTANNDVQFQIGAYDVKHALIIDPGLTYASFVGGAQATPVANSTVTGVAMDFGGVYFVGTTTDLAFDTNILSQGTSDVMVGIFADQSLHTLSKTILSGGQFNNDEGNGIAIDATHIVVVGDTNAGINFPGVSSGGSLNQPLGLVNKSEVNLNQHAFVAVMGKAATTLGTTSILAGIGAEQATAVAIDKAGKLHIVGQTSSPDFLTNIGAGGKAAQATLQSDNQTNAFYVVMPNTLASVSYGTFLGGFGYDRANAVAVDNSNDASAPTVAYITGVSTSWRNFNPNPPAHQNFPVQPPVFCGTGIPTRLCIPVQNPPKPPMTMKTFTGGVHAFVAAINPTATGSAPSLLYSLPLGGDLVGNRFINNNDGGQTQITTNESDIGTTITVDANYNVYVGGDSCPNAAVATAFPFGINTDNYQTTGINVACGTTAAGNLHMSVGGGPGAPGSGSAHNVVFTAPAIVTGTGTAAGPGVVAQVNVTSGGFYTGTPTVTFDPPSLPRGTLTCPTIFGPNGCQATGHAVMSGNAVDHVIIDNQGFGYTVAPAVTFSGGNGSGAAATVVVGTVVLGNQTAATVANSPASDGWVVAINNPGSYTITDNGISLISGSPLDITLPPGASFPAFEYGTLANGDETNGNGTGVASTPNSINQVTGIVTDYGVVATGNGTTGALSNAYISGGTSAANTGGAGNGNPALIRRRINTAGRDATIPLIGAHPKSPFTRGVLNWPSAAQFITNVGDLLMVNAPVLNTTAATALPASVNTATGVAFDPSTNRSCIGATVTNTTPTPVFGTANTMFTVAPLPAKATYPGNLDDGLVACVPFLNDTTVTNITGGVLGNPGTQGTTLTFTMQAGTTPQSLAPFTALTTSANNTATISLTNPNSLVQPPTINLVAYSPGGLLGPASGTSPHVDWLRISNTVNAGGTTVVLSLLDQAFLNVPAHLNPASQLDPGFYQAVVSITPTGNVDNAGVPTFFTINLIVTGDVYTNTAVAGGTPANVNVQLLEGKGWTDVGLNTKVINIPIVTAVPVESPSFSNIVFDLVRDANGNPIFSNTTTANVPPTSYPVLGLSSLTGGLRGLSFTPGSNYPPNLAAVPANVITFSPPPGLASCAAPTATLACPVVEFTTDPTGHVSSTVIVNPGMGYQNPPTGTFPLPLAGGTQALVTNVTITNGNATTADGGTVDLRPTTGLTPGTIGCGSTPFANDMAPMGLALEDFACYIQVKLPSSILSGAPAGVYSGTFYLWVPNDTTYNDPSQAPESNPPSPSPTVFFSPVGSSTLSTNTQVAVTINVTVGIGSLTVNSPWVSNVAPFIVNPPTVPPMMPLAPFAVPYNYTGTVNSSNNNVPYIQGVTGNNPNQAIHTISVDSRNLLLSQSGKFLTTITPGIDANAQLAYTEQTGCPGDDQSCTPLPGNVLPIATCTSDPTGTVTPPIPVWTAANPTGLKIDTSGILPASNGTSTTTDITFSIVDPHALAPGFYASTVTIAANDANGNPILDGTGAPVAVAVPVCLTVGNNLQWQVYDTNVGTAIASGRTQNGKTFQTGQLFMETADEPQFLADEIFALGPSQNSGLAIPGGPLFAPADTRLEVPITMTPLPTCQTPTSGGFCNQTWEFPPTFPTNFANMLGTSCHGQEAAASCTPAARFLEVTPQQNTAASINYVGGFSVAASVALGLPSPTGLLGAAPAAMNAYLPVWISSGPTIITNPTATSNPLGNIVSGSVVSIIINNPGSLYTTAPAVTFAGGCVNEPTAVALVDPTHGNISRIVLTSLGSSCTTQPFVTIAPPTTPGGTQATATALISDATVNVSFTETVGQLNTVPIEQDVWITPSDQHIFGLTFGPLFFNSLTVQTWLDSFESAACFTPGGMPFNPNQAEPGFFNGCQVEIVPRGLVVSSLAPGTYTAWMVITATPPTMPAVTAVVVQLNVVNQQQATCTPVITDSANNNFGTTLGVNGTSTSGYYPSTPLSLAVSFAPPASATCSYTAAVSSNTAGVAPFVTLMSGATGGGVGTVTYNAFANTLLSPRTNTITVTSSTGTTASYTITEPASTQSQLLREVMAMYQRILGREGDTGGVNYWSCVQGPAPCANLGIPGLGQMADSFVTSWEGEYTGYQIIAIYKALLNRAPTFAEWFAARQTYVANDTPNGWIAASQALANSLMNSGEYAQHFGAASNTSLLVSTLYQNTLGRTPTGPESTAGINAIVNGGTTAGLYAELLNIWGTTPNPGFNPTEPANLIFTAGAYQATTNVQYIDYLYYAILARDIDAGGFAFWLSQANAAGTGVLFSNFNTRLPIEGNGNPGAGFIGSPEFQNTFNH